ncbi:SixA phosphatase family protein [Desulfurispira natronophila]|uniref:Phosphohistidine phosphatase n=1 Tax=Desulfurispira natronophila TaxID=682562 RepID=A0A7W7Y4R9_9BACT|nr:histidine phosphatase family protein [Desulfurispira natronophila]MBB5021777.1 phosphohistidine phosphatase [Desulfurispira natronophila]
MKYLYIIRHAKSSWDAGVERDRDRPLNDRGQRDAPRIGQTLQELAVKPDAIICSPALRTWTTACEIAHQIGYAERNIQTNERLYEASLQDILAVISGPAFPSVDNSILVGHNPGLTDLVNAVSNMHIDNLPTSGTVCLRFDMDSWSDIGQQCGQWQFFYTPKRGLMQASL